MTNIYDKAIFMIAHVLSMQKFRFCCFFPHYLRFQNSKKHVRSEIKHRGVNWHEELNEDPIINRTKSTVSTMLVTVSQNVK